MRGAAAVRERERARKIEEVTHSHQYAEAHPAASIPVTALQPAGQPRCHSLRRVSASAIAAAAATFSEPTRPSCGM